MSDLTLPRRVVLSLAMLLAVIPAVIIAVAAAMPVEQAAVVWAGCTGVFCVGIVQMMMSLRVLAAALED